MNRRELLATAGILSVTTLAIRSAESKELESDPWEGSYLKYSQYDTERVGGFGEAVILTVTKQGDGYTLGKPYAEQTFHEVSNGVLSDGSGGLGKIFRGTAEYSDGMKVPILRAEFCYESFVMYGVERAKAKMDKADYRLFKGMPYLTVDEFSDALEREGYQHRFLGHQLLFQCRCNRHRGELDEKDVMYARIEGLKKLPSANLVNLDDDLVSRLTDETMLDVHGLLLEQNYGVWSIWVYSAKIL